MEKNKNRGFTLIEVVLVVILLGVIAVMTIPNFSRSFSQMQIKKKVDEIAHLMRYAQARAMTQQKILRLNFDKKHSSYWLTELAESEESAEEKFVRLSNHKGRDYAVSDEFKLGLEQPIIQFYLDGTIDKTKIEVCLEGDCFTISTKEQRGTVWVFDSKVIDSEKNEQRT